MVKNIINECLKLLDKQDLNSKVNSITQNGGFETELLSLTEKDRNDILLLIELLPSVVNSVARMICPMVKVEKLKSDSDKKIFYSDFSDSLVSIKDITDELNNPIVFRAFYDHLLLPYANHEFYITYTFEMPAVSSIFDEVNLPLGLSCSILALGIVSKYLSIKLLYNEAEMFESKFIAELESIRPKSGSRNFWVWRN